MANIGTTLQAMGRRPEAEHFWFKAIQIRPTYWDAVVSSGDFSSYHKSPNLHLLVLKIG